MSVRYRSRSLRPLSNELSGLAVAIATRRRAPILRETVRELRRQTLSPDRIMVCYTEPEDILGLDQHAGIELFRSLPGLTRQRNVLMDAATDCDVMVFLDDDFLPQPQYLEATMMAMATPGVMVTTGFVLEDGSIGQGYTVEDARAFLANDHYEGPWPNLSPVYNCYGCNMAVRLDVVREEAIRFDERLPLYGYLEDLDFSRRVGAKGLIVKVGAARGVHLATKSSRVSDVRMGYSQVANVIYLWNKGTLGSGYAAKRMGRHLINNILRSMTPEPYIDRRARAVGNWMAIADTLRGRLRPERVLDL